MKYYLKQIGREYLYFSLTAVTALMMAVMSNEGFWLWLKFAIYVINFLILALAISIMFFREGQTAYKQLGINDVVRRQIVETGKDLPIKREEEYRPLKGFILPLFLFIPMAVLLIGNLIYGLCTGGGEVNTFGMIAGLIYMAFYSPAVMFIPEAQISWVHPFIVLYAVPLICIIAGVAYILGAKKKKKEDEAILSKQKQIYGDKK